MEYLLFEATRTVAMECVRNLNSSTFVNSYRFSLCFFNVIRHFQYCFFLVIGSSVSLSFDQVFISGTFFWSIGLAYMRSLRAIRTFGLFFIFFWCLVIHFFCKFISNSSAVDSFMFRIHLFSSWP